MHRCMYKKKKKNNTITNTITHTCITWTRKWIKRKYVSRLWQLRASVAHKWLLYKHTHQLCQETMAIKHVLFWNIKDFIHFFNFESIRARKYPHGCFQNLHNIRNKEFMQQNLTKWQKMTEGVNFYWTTLFSNILVYHWKYYLLSFTLQNLQTQMICQFDPTNNHKCDMISVTFFSKIIVIKYFFHTYIACLIIWNNFL